MGALVGDALGTGDVIVAPATPPGTSALAVVRLSGPPGRTLDVARRLAAGLPERPSPRRARRAVFLDAEGEPLDEGLVLFFEAPRSATGEEVVELHAHGSPAVVAALLEAARRAGARAAAPGEFTRRALANGKLDLSRAEGIAGLTAAATRAEARRALALAEGSLATRVGRLREALLDDLAAREALLDFAEDVGLREAGDGRRRLAAVRAEIGRLIEGAAARAPGHRPIAVIAGRPNAGKSTLFNALLGTERAIVSPSPGTTRDAVAEVARFAGAEVRLVDTAGLRGGADAIEREGVAVARRAAASADVLVLAVDAATADRPDPVETGARTTILVATKSDLVDRVPFPADVAVSARTGQGLAALRESLARAVASTDCDGELMLLERHRSALGAAAEALDGALRLDDAPELAAAEVRRALQALAEITGETATEELLDRVFSAFCIGK